MRCIVSGCEAVAKPLSNLCPVHESWGSEGKAIPPAIVSPRISREVLDVLFEELRHRDNFEAAANFVIAQPYILDYLVRDLGSIEAAAVRLTAMEMFARALQLQMQRGVMSAGLQVQRRMCATCIYRKDSPLDLKKLEGEIADKYGGFDGFRICHHSPTACCRGFWNRHKDKFALGQIAQRLGMVVEVDHA